MSDFGFDPGETSASQDVKVLRNECHRLFDQLWETQDSRDWWYGFLADVLGIPKGDCHFRMMGLQTLYRSRAILQRIHEIKEDIEEDVIRAQFEAHKRERLRSLQQDLPDGI